MIEAKHGSGEARCAHRFPARKARRLRMVWHLPTDAAAWRALNEAFRALTGGEKGEPVQLPLHGRGDRRAAGRRRASRGSTSPSSANNRSARRIISLWPSVFTRSCRRHSGHEFEERNEAKRFITLIDALYDSASSFWPPPRRSRDSSIAAQRARGFRIRPHGLAPDRNAFERISGPAARPGRLPSGDMTGLVET